MDSRLRTLNREYYPAGTVILREGEPGMRAYVIESGEVEIWRDVDGRRRRLGIVGERGIFGEMALIDDEPRMASASALTDTTCIVVTDDVFRKKMAGADPFLAGLLRIFVRNIRSLAEHHHMNGPPPDGDSEDR